VTDETLTLIANSPVTKGALVLLLLAGSALVVYLVRHLTKEE